MPPEDDADARLADEALTTIERLANGLADIADTLHNQGLSVTFQPDARREIEIDLALAQIGAARALVEDAGDELTAIAAIAGYPMARLGELVGLSETAVPIRLARTKRLSPYAKGSGTPRVGRAELGAAAWDFRRGGHHKHRNEG